MLSVWELWGKREDIVEGKYQVLEWDGKKRWYI